MNKDTDSKVQEIKTIGVEINNAREAQKEAKKVEVVTIQPEPIKTPPVAPVQPVQANNAELAAKLFIYNKESGNNPHAINRSSGACGIGQALPCSKMGCALGDYACQDAWFTNYAIRRYGSWQNAQAFWQSRRWW